MRIEPEKRLIKYDENPDVLKISKATTIESGGLTVTAGGATITAGDVTITAGSLVQTVPNAAFTDPGDAGVITLTSGAVHNIVVVTTAGSETRVMGIPQFIGQECAIHHGTDGGAFTMTNASGWKGGTTSDDVATFTEVEDVMIVKACGLDAVDWRWIADVGVAIA
jgi:adhesin HecA-like repeat protein